MKHKKYTAQESKFYNNHFKMSVRLIVFEKIDFDHIAQTNLSRPLRGEFLSPWSKINARTTQVSSLACNNYEYGFGIFLKCVEMLLKCSIVECVHCLTGVSISYVYFVSNFGQTY